jgi:hypothetical protein
LVVIFTSFNVVNNFQTFSAGATTHILFIIYIVHRVCLHIYMFVCVHSCTMCTYDRIFKKKTTTTTTVTHTHTRRYTHVVTHDNHSIVLLRILIYCNTRAHKVAQHQLCCLQCCLQPILVDLRSLKGANSHLIIFNIT